MKISKIKIGLPTMTAWVVLIVLATVIIMWGCGRKAPPEPPSGSRTPIVKDLAYSISQNTITLSWTIPQTDETAQLPITGFLIYRSQRSVLENECPNCPILYKNIGDVPVRRPGSGQSGGPPITFTQTIEPGFRYIYKVHGYSTDGIRSKTSNLVQFTF